MDRQQIIEWLLNGDVSIQFQTYRDLLNIEHNDLQERIERQGWGKSFLSKRKPELHWGDHFYQPKWISSHYTILDLRNLGISPQQKEIQESVSFILSTEKSETGCIKPIGHNGLCDVCINGIFLNYASYFQTDAKALESVVDFLLDERMEDGGFNCQRNRIGAHHSSMHTTISVLEGITEYQRNGYTYRLAQLKQAKQTAVDFLLLHQLYISDRTGEIIKKDFLRLPYPSRWKYDILRALDYFQYARIPWDDRLLPAIQVLLKKRNKYGTWNVNAKYPGQVHIEMEKAGKPSRWNTLRALRTLDFYKSDLQKLDLDMKQFSIT